MTSDPIDPTITPPPANVPETLAARPRVHFSGMHWFFTGLVRVSYRAWTRVAAALFPENSRAEHVARALHLPLPDQLNMSWVTQRLAVGGRVHSQDIPALAHVGVTHVVDTRSEYCDDEEELTKAHIAFLHLPAPDTRPLTVQQLMEGARWVNESMQNGGRVLIHCEHGVGRSVLLTCASLVYGGMHARDALELVQEKRWQAAPNHSQVARLREFEAALDASSRAARNPSPSA